MKISPIFAEFEGDPAAIARLTDTARWGGTLDHQAELLRQERADKAENERLRRELETAGFTVTAALPPGSQLLTGLRHDGDDLTPAAHGNCPGRGPFFHSYDPVTPLLYCADPAARGHTFAYAGGRASAPAARTADRPGPAGTPDAGPRAAVPAYRRDRWPRTPISCDDVLA